MRFQLASSRCRIWSVIGPLSLTHYTYHCSVARDTDVAFVYFISCMYRCSTSVHADNLMLD